MRNVHPAIDLSILVFPPVNVPLKTLLYRYLIVKLSIASAGKMHLIIMSMEVACAAGSRWPHAPHQPMTVLENVLAPEEYLCLKPNTIRSGFYSMLFPPQSSLSSSPPNESKNHNTPHNLVAIWASCVVCNAYLFTGALACGDVLHLATTL